MFFAVTGLGLFAAVGAACVSYFAVGIPKKRRKRFEDRVAKFLAEQETVDGALPLGDGAFARLRLEAVKPRRAVLEATIGPSHKPFPFSLQINLSPKSERRSVGTNGGLNGKAGKRLVEPLPWAQLTGNKSMFWAVFDEQQREWLRDARITINERRLRLVVTDEASSDRMYDGQFSQWLAEQIALVRDLIAAVQQDTFIGSMAARLAEHPHHNGRLRMLDLWLRENDPLPQPPPAFDAFQDSRHPEFWMLVLDNGGDPPAPMQDAMFARQDETSQKMLRTIIRRQDPARCRKYALIALKWQAHRTAAVDMLGRFEDPTLFPAIVAAYWEKPEDKLLELIAQYQDPAIVALMLELLERGERATLMPAVAYLSHFGERNALAPIINVRKQIPLFSVGKWEQAVNRLRRRLGPAPEVAGALSLVTIDGQQGALTPAAQGADLAVAAEADPAAGAPHT